MEYLGNCGFFATTRSIKTHFFRFWNESRCNRKFSGIEKYHGKFCNDTFDEVFFGILPPPPLLPPPPILYNLIAGAGDQKKPKDVGRSREYENADEINSKYSRGSVHLALSKSLRASPNNKRPAAKAIDSGNMGCQVTN